MHAVVLFFRSCKAKEQSQNPGRRWRWRWRLKVALKVNIWRTCRHVWFHDRLSAVTPVLVRDGRHMRE